MKFCKDCKYHVQAERFYDDVCTNPTLTQRADTQTMVRGTRGEVHCSEARIWSQDCGKEARYFEPIQGADEIAGIKGIVAK